MEEKPRVVAINKMDLPEVRARKSEFGRELDVPLYFISAATGEGLQELMNKTLELVSKSGAFKQKDEAEFKVFRPRPLSPRKAQQRRGGDD